MDEEYVLIALVCVLCYAFYPSSAVRRPRLTPIFFYLRVFIICYPFDRILGPLSFVLSVVSSVLLATNLWLTWVPIDYLPTCTYIHTYVYLTYSIHFSQILSQSARTEEDSLQIPPG